MKKIEIFTRGIEITTVFILGLSEGNFYLESQIPPKTFTLYTCKTIKSAFKFILRESNYYVHTYMTLKRSQDGLTIYIYTH